MIAARASWKVFYEAFIVKGIDVKGTPRKRGMEMGSLVYEGRSTRSDDADEQCGDGDESNEAEVDEVRGWGEGGCQGRGDGEGETSK